MGHERRKPPPLAKWIVNRAMNQDIRQRVLDDLDEFYQMQYNRNGSSHSSRLYWRQVLKSVPMLFKEKLYWKSAMLKNYLIVAFRNIQRHKGYTLINITGLAFGMTVCFLIIIWVKDEFSFDHFHEYANRIHRVYSDVQAGSPMTLAMTMPPLKQAALDIPEVACITQIAYPSRTQITIGDKTFQEDLVGYADRDLFNVFSFALVKGVPQAVLEAPGTAVLSRATAEKYFGSDDPIGEVIKIGGDKEYTITGIVEDIPTNSHFRFNIMRSFETLYEEQPEAMKYWLHIQFYTYMLLTESARPKDVEEKLPAIVETHMGQLLRGFGGSLALHLQPLTRIHLHSDMMGELSPGGSMTTIFLFLSVASLILAVASMNFINLATARSSTRAREVGLRKTLGAQRGKLIGQFLGESLLFSFLSLVLALLLTSLFLPGFESFIGRPLSTNMLTDAWILARFFGLALITGIAAGAYPAFFLSSFHPTRTLKNAPAEGGSKPTLRRMLVVFQFCLSIFLIIATTTIYRQIHYMKNKPLGLDEKHIVVIPDVTDLVRQTSLTTLREEFLGIPGIINVSGSFLMPSRSIGKGIYTPEGFLENQSQTTNRMGMDAHFIPTMRMDIVAGRNFSEELSTENESVIINETAVRLFGWKDPIGKTLSTKTPDGRKVIRNVVGVVRDFHHLSMHRIIEPLVITYMRNSITYLSLRISPVDLSHTLDLVENKWREIAHDKPFDYFFLEDSYDQLYTAEERIGTIAIYFCGLTVLIGCLGLFGLSAYTAERRTKEVGIRKVLGASMPGIFNMVSREFIILVGVASLAAWPLAYFGLKRWLQNFAYRINLEWILFAGASLLAVMIALITVSYQTAKLTRTNPIDALRYE